MNDAAAIASFPATGRMLDPRRWARLEENSILTETSYDAFPRPADLSGHPQCLTWVQDYMLVEYQEPARFVTCHDASILMWMLPYEHGFNDYLFFPFTSRMNGVARDLWRAKVAPFVTSFDDADCTATFDFGQARFKHIQTEGACCFIGGRDNFLHWLMDHLALALLYEAEPQLKAATFLVPKLENWQKETLRFFGINNPILQIEPIDNCSTFFTFERVILPTNFPLAERFKALRRRYATLHGEPKGQGQGIYLSRGAMNPRHRVANEEEVAAFFAEAGFLVLYPETMPLEEVATCCANADVVASAPGSANANYFVFGANDSVLIYMVPSNSKEEVSYAQATVGYANLLVFVDRLVTVFGRKTASLNPTQIDEDKPEHYSIDDLAIAVQRAKAMVAARVEQRLTTPEEVG